MVNGSSSPENTSPGPTPAAVILPWEKDASHDRGRSAEARLSGSMETVEYALPASDGEQLAWLHDHGEVVSRQSADEMIHVTVRLRPADRARFERQAKRSEGFAA